MQWPGSKLRVSSLQIRLWRSARETIGLLYIAELTCIIGRSVIVLNFLQEEEIRRLQVLDNVRSDSRQMCRVRCQVFDVVGAKSDSVALSIR